MDRPRPEDLRQRAATILSRTPVGPDISARRSYRSLVSALHERKGTSTQSMVRLLGERDVRDGTFGTPKVHQMTAVCGARIAH